jgi:hypothetical protein
MFRTLRDHDGTPLVALDSEELEVDGVIDPDGEIPDEKQVHVQRLDEGAYLVRDVSDEDGIADLPEWMGA